MSNEEYAITVTDFINLAANNLTLDRTRIEIGQANFRLANEYAIQEAIAFSEWNCKSLWSTHNGMWYPYQNEDNPITGEQLYELFLQSKQI